MFSHENLSESWVKSYLQIAHIIAQHSKAEKRKVGAVLVKDRKIISYGFNGMPTGFPNACEDANGKTLPEVLHAELNCLAKCSTSTESSKDSTMFITLAPCIRCAQYIIQCGVVQVYYFQQNKNDGLDLLKRANIPCIYIECNFQVV